MGGLDQREGNGDEHRHLRRVQREDTVIQLQQLRVFQDRGQPLGVGFGVRVKAGADRVRNDQPDADQRRQRQRAGERENAVDADVLGQQRPQHQAGGEGGADGHAYHRHRLGTIFLAGQVRQQRGDGGGNGAGALNNPAHGQGGDVVRAGGDEAAQRKQQQAAVNHSFAAYLVGQHAQRQLQQGLGQAVTAQRDADQRVVVRAFQGLGVQGEYRQDQEHAQHAQGVDAGEAKAGPEFCCVHSCVRRLCCWRAAA